MVRARGQRKLRHVLCFRQSKFFQTWWREEKGSLPRQADSAIHVSHDGIFSFSARQISSLRGTETALDINKRGRSSLPFHHHLLLRSALACGVLRRTYERARKERGKYIFCPLSVVQQKDLRKTKRDPCAEYKNTCRAMREEGEDFFCRGGE